MRCGGHTPDPADSAARPPSETATHHERTKLDEVLTPEYCPTADITFDVADAVGGVGVEGTFTFSPPPGWTDTAAYRYSFMDGEELTEIPAGPDGRATLTWTPTTSGRVNLMVFALRPDGTWSGSAHEYYFEVAESS